MTSILSGKGDLNDLAGETTKLIDTVTGGDSKAVVGGVTKLTDQVKIPKIGGASKAVSNEVSKVTDKIKIPVKIPKLW